MAPLKMDSQISEDIKKITNPRDRIIIRGLIILLLLAGGVIGILFYKNDGLYKELKTQDRACADRWIEMVNNANRKADIAKAIADSIHDLDQAQMRALMRERIEAVGQQAKQIDKELKR